ncbi:MAG: FAD/NAD(P)-binding protein [Thermoanaerobaculia bacterium]|nr:FAD/NAD(P)-binding protein [Thermoanaerobaculia bacterium]
MLEWLIIGGGVHGTLLSRVLVQEAGLRRDRVAVLDPHDRPLARFLECAAATGMGHLRSTVVHHLDADPMSLRRFALRQPGADAHLMGPYQRPTVEVFAAHCRELASRHGLDDLRLRGEARLIERRNGSFRVDTSAGSLDARRVLLAIGGTEDLCLPGWAEPAAAQGAWVRHVFSPGFCREAVGPWRHLVVVGGGLSAVQTALSLSRQAAAAGHGEVTLLARHPRRIHDFDTDSGWMGPKLERGFARIADRGRRRSVIVDARHRGSTPREVAQRLRAEITAERLAERRGEVVEVRVEAASMRLTLDDGDRLEADRVVLATGFRNGRPGGAWLERTIGALGLQYAACGYPVVDESLCWAPGIYVTGPLAELEIGPAARNIHGARLAGKRVLAVARG